MARRPVRHDPPDRRPRTFLEEHPDVVRDLISGLGDAIDVANDDAAAAQATVNDGIEAITTKPAGRRDDQPAPGRTSSSRSTRSPRRCRARPTTPSPSGCSTRSTSPTPASTTSTLLNEVLAERGEDEVSGALMSGRSALARASTRRSASGRQRRHRARTTSTSRCDAGRVRVPHRRLGVRQVDDPQPRRRARRAERRHASTSTAAPALMFQESALFPWLTVAANVELPMRLAGVPKAERRARVEQLLTAVHLDGFAKKRPHQLSGGMRQRGALARAFAQDAEHPADGRAVRRARRDDPRRAPRRARRRSCATAA